MKALVAVENRLWRAPEGFMVRGPAGYAVWSELLEFFDQVLLVARVQKNKNGSIGEQVNGPSVSIHELPDFSGPWQYSLRLPAVQRRVREAVAQCDAYFLQVPGLIAHFIWWELRRTRKPYAVNAMGDPWDALSPGTLRTCLRPIYRLVLTRDMRRMCSHAQAALYWSQTLQQRYPVPENSYATVSPRIVLPCGFASPDLVRQRASRAHASSGSDQDKQNLFRLGFIGSFEQLCKGPDTLLHAVHTCLRAGLEVRAFLVGEGRYCQAMESLARELSIQDKVEFLGQLGPGRPIVDFLDSLDLFLMPSRAEGLPRALVEAMARACPCVGSEVGGIPELLHRDDLVPPGNPQRLAAKILEAATNPERLMQMSLRNLKKAKEFDPESLRKRRRDFYRFVKLQAGLSGARENGGIPVAKDCLPLEDR